MKTFLNFIIVLNLFSLPVFAQKKSDSCQNLIIKGYILKQYRKSEIISIKADAKSIPIDFYQRSYFVPISKDIFNQQTIDSINIFNANEVYFLPFKETSFFVKKFCGGDIPTQSNLPLKLDLDGSFFQIGSGQNELLYKIYYSEFKAVKSEILNNSFNTFQLNIPFDKKSKFVICYFAHQNLILEEIKQVQSKNFISVKL